MSDVSQRRRYILLEHHKIEIVDRASSKEHSFLGCMVKNRYKQIENSSQRLFGDRSPWGEGVDASNRCQTSIKHGHSVASLPLRLCIFIPLHQLTLKKSIATRIERSLTVLHMDSYGRNLLPGQRAVSNHHRDHKSNGSEPRLTA